LDIDGSGGCRFRHHGAHGRRSKTGNRNAKQIAPMHRRGGGVPSRKTLSKIIEPKSWHRIRLSNSAPDLKMTDVNIPSRIGQIPMTTGAYGNVAGEEMPLPTTGTASIDDRFDACQ
jgi:hypothetical protein